MKYLTVMCFVVLWLIASNKSYSQTIIQDPHVQAQQDRMVATQWGNWLPEPKYFLGIQTNIHYTLTWGILAPSRNRSYKRGADIRPLSATGEQTQRMALNERLKEINSAYKTIADSTGQTALSELQYNSGLISEGDPMWLIYYKKELKPVTNYNLNEAVATLSNEELSSMIDCGTIEWYDNEMLRLKERLNSILTSNMERSSRIMAYHRILLEYRLVGNKWNSNIETANFSLEISDGKGNLSPVISGDAAAGFSQWDTDSDYRIMESIMLNTKIK